ncbi:MAG: hypothetical protein C4K60_19690 [Ideonella sp. MAG2]|nr:MAG: hypothetical protein C4K60_19690 [Ideonella sp. MAG2]
MLALVAVAIKLWPSASEREGVVVLNANGSPQASSAGGTEASASEGQGANPAAAKTNGAKSPPFPAELAGKDVLSQQEQQKLIQQIAAQSPSKEDVAMAEKTAKYLAYSAKITKFLAEKNPKLTPEEYRALVDETRAMNKGRYLTLGEAHNLEARFLATQYSGAVLEKKLAELNAEYKKTFERLTAEGSTPSKEFLAYKAFEQSVLAEADKMTAFPNGMSKSEYILQRLKQAPGR